MTAESRSIYVQGLELGWVPIEPKSSCHRILDLDRTRVVLCYAAVGKPRLSRFGKDRFGQRGGSLAP